VPAPDRAETTPAPTRTTAIVLERVIVGGWRSTMDSRERCNLTKKPGWLDAWGVSHLQHVRLFVSLSLSYPVPYRDALPKYLDKLPCRALSSLPVFYTTCNGDGAESVRRSGPPRRRRCDVTGAGYNRGIHVETNRTLIWWLFRSAGRESHT
jgi:hypothetical protein